MPKAQAGDDQALPAVLAPGQRCLAEVTVVEDAGAQVQVVAGFAGCRQFFWVARAALRPLPAQ